MNDNDTMTREVSENGKHRSPGQFRASCAHSSATGWQKTRPSPPLSITNVKNVQCWSSRGPNSSRQAGRGLVRLPSYYGHASPCDRARPSLASLPHSTSRMTSCPSSRSSSRHSGTLCHLFPPFFPCRQTLTQSNPATQRALALSLWLRLCVHALPAVPPALHEARPACRDSPAGPQTSSSRQSQQQLCSKAIPGQQTGIPNARPGCSSKFHRSQKFS